MPSKQFNKIFKKSMKIFKKNFGEERYEHLCSLIKEEDPDANISIEERIQITEKRDSPYDIDALNTVIHGTPEEKKEIMAEFERKSKGIDSGVGNITRKCRKMKIRVKRI